MAGRMFLGTTSVARVAAETVSGAVGEPTPVRQMMPPGETVSIAWRTSWITPVHSTTMSGCRSGVELRVDLGMINGQVFVNNASFGAYADL
jgi:hypothetical protein